MASICHRPNRPSPWQVKYRDANGKQRSRSFTRKADAQRFRHQVEHAHDRGQVINPDAGRISFSTLAEAWWEGKRIADRKPSTIAGYRSLLDRLLLPAFAGQPVGGITYDDVVQVAGTWGHLSASRRRAALMVLAQVLDLAITRGHVQANVARLVDQPTLPPRTRHRYLDHRQLHDLADSCGPYRPLILLLGYGGLRWGEAVALEQTDIDRARGFIHVDRSQSEVDGRLQIVAPKTHQRRDVPVPDLVLDALPTSTGRLFSTANDRPLRASNFRLGVWLPATAVSGLQGLRIHDLRHTAASLARAAGSDAFIVARMLGHKDPSVTAQVYADLFDVELTLVRRRMQAAAEAALGERSGNVSEGSEGILEEGQGTGDQRTRRSQAM